VGSSHQNLASLPKLVTSRPRRAENAPTLR